MDAKLGDRQQELHRVQQELDIASQELEEIAKSKQHPQFAKPDLQNVIANIVTMVGPRYCT